MVSATAVRAAEEAGDGLTSLIQWRVVASAIALLAIGAALGLVLHHAAFGFTRAYRRLVTARDTRGVRAQLVMLALTTGLFAPVLASSGGAAGAVAPASLSVVIGIASTSVHGWLWAAAALIGTPVGVRLRRRFGLGG